MEPWSWILVYLVGFTLFQLLLFRYFSNGRAFDGVSLGSGETASPRSVERGQPTREATQAVENDDGDERDDGVHCPHCGARNEDEQFYTYCSNCLAQLR